VADGVGVDFGVGCAVGPGVGVGPGAGLAVGTGVGVATGVEKGVGVGLADAEEGIELEGDCNEPDIEFFAPPQAAQVNTNPKKNFSIKKNFFIANLPTSLKVSPLL